MTRRHSALGEYRAYRAYQSIHNANSPKAAGLYSAAAIHQGDHLVPGFRPFPLPDQKHVSLNVCRQDAAQRSVLFPDRLPRRVGDPTQQTNDSSGTDPLKNTVGVRGRWGAGIYQEIVHLGCSREKRGAALFEEARRLLANPDTNEAQFRAQAANIFRCAEARAARLPEDQPFTTEVTEVTEGIAVYDRLEAFLHPDRAKSPGDTGAPLPPSSLPAPSFLPSAAATLTPADRA